VYNFHHRPEKKGQRSVSWSETAIHIIERGSCRFLRSFAISSAVHESCLSLAILLNISLRYLMTSHSRNPNQFSAGRKYDPLNTFCRNKVRVILEFLHRFHGSNIVCIPGLPMAITHQSQSHVEYKRLQWVCG
jgi:hypothetical protein